MCKDTQKKTVRCEKLRSLIHMFTKTGRGHAEGSIRALKINGMQ